MLIPAGRIARRFLRGRRWVAVMKVRFSAEELTKISPSSVHGWGMRPKNCNFTKFGNISAHAHCGHNPCTILVKFSGFVNN